MIYPARANAKPKQYVTCRPCARHVFAANKTEEKLDEWVTARTEVLCAGVDESYGSLPGHAQVDANSPTEYLSQMERLYDMLLAAELAGSIIFLKTMNVQIKRELWNVFVERIPLKKVFSKDELDYGKTIHATLHSVSRPHVV